MATIKEQFEIHTSEINEATRLLLEELNDREGQYVWKQLTAEDGDFLSYVVADDENSYPDGGELDGYWYEAFKEGGGVPIKYEYSGSSNLAYSVRVDENGIPSLSWQLKLLTSGNLKITHLECPIHDIFLVGGGGGGGGVTQYGVSGGGGGGGCVISKTNADFKLNTDYAVIIGAGGTAGAAGGAGGTGGKTSAFGLSADGGSGGGAGGSDGSGVGGTGGSGGGGAAPSIAGGAGKGVSTRAFGDTDGSLYAGGGSGGTYRKDRSGTYIKGGVGGSNGSNGGAGNADSTASTTQSVASGGAGGGGNGGKAGVKGGNGTANTGGGGGGAGSDNRVSGGNGTSGLTGGTGGSGIVILRGRYA